MRKASGFADNLINVQAERNSLDKKVTAIVSSRSVYECGGLGLFAVTNEGRLSIARTGAECELANPDEALKLGKWLVDTFGE